MTQIELYNEVMDADNRMDEIIKLAKPHIKMNKELSKKYIEGKL